MLFSALILGTRCANYADVFVDGRVYFVDADCYSRMTRVRMVAQHPGTIVRHHGFENFPAGVAPHTTAPLDYLIVGLATLLRPFTAQPIDLAGAFISPLLGLAGGWFLGWWLRDLAWSGRIAAMLVYALSGILVHGTALGRPDHQGLLILLLLVALAAEWKLQQQPSRGWGIASGLGWGLALWVSCYEPLVLFVVLLLGSILLARAQITARPRRPGWGVFLGVILLAAAVERRWPGWPFAQPFFAGWSATVGELQTVPLTNSIWLDWCGALLLVSPLLLALALRRRALPPIMLLLLAIAFALTLWQARWGYFFVLLFVLTVPAQMAVMRRSWWRGLTICLLLLSFLHFWETRLWPDETEAARRTTNRNEAAQWRAAAMALRSFPRSPIMAPWWLAPATAYWSGQPVVAGSSHESLPGIVASARFYLATSAPRAQAILQEHAVQWIMVCDDGRLAENSAAVLSTSAPAEVLCRTLDRTPSRAPAFLELWAQTSACKIYRVRDFP